MSLIELTAADGSYDRMKAVWKKQCEVADEDFETFAQGTFLVLDALARKPERNSGIFAVPHEESVASVICQVNCTPLPNHPEPVLRVRMVTMSPELDFGTAPGDDLKGRYADNLVSLLFGVIELSQLVSERHMNAREIKFHLRSPHDFDFFRALTPALAKITHFEYVAMKGAWLYITRNA